MYKTNKDLIVSENIDVLRKYALYFPGSQSDGRLRQFAADFADLGIKHRHLEEVFEFLKVELDYFPSYKEIYAHTKKYINSGAHDEEQARLAHQAQILSKEALRLSDITSKYESKMAGRKSLLEYIEYWYSLTYGSDQVALLKEYGLELSLFAKPALFDLEESGWDFTKLAEICRTKAQKARLEIRDKAGEFPKSFFFRREFYEVDPEKYKTWSTNENYN